MVPHDVRILEAPGKAVSVISNLAGWGTESQSLGYGWALDALGDCQMGANHRSSMSLAVNIFSVFKAKRHSLSQPLESYPSPAQQFLFLPPLLMVQMIVLIPPDNSIQPLHLEVDHFNSFSVCDIKINRVHGPSCKHSLEPIDVPGTPSKEVCWTCGTTMSKSTYPYSTFCDHWPSSPAPAFHSQDHHKGCTLNPLANISFFNEWRLYKFQQPLSQPNLSQTANFPNKSTPNVLFLSYQGLHHRPGEETVNFS